MWLCFKCRTTYTSLNVYGNHLLDFHELVIPTSKLEGFLPLGYVYCLLPQNVQQLSLTSDLDNQDVDQLNGVVQLSLPSLALLKPCLILLDRVQDPKLEDVEDIEVLAEYYGNDNAVQEPVYTVNRLPRVASRPGAANKGQENVCQFCKTVFDVNEDLIKHLRICLERPDKFSCFNCGRAFKSKGNLKHHESKKSCLNHVYEMEQAGAENEPDRKKNAKDVFQFVKHPQKLRKSNDIKLPSKHSLRKNIRNTVAKESILKARKTSHKTQRTPLEISIAARQVRAKKSPQKKEPGSPRKVNNPLPDLKRLSPSANALQLFEGTKESLLSYIKRSEINGFPAAVAGEGKNGIWQPVRKRNGVTPSHIKTEYTDDCSVKKLVYENNLVIRSSGKVSLRCAECGLFCNDLKALEVHIADKKVNHGYLDLNITRLLDKTNAFQCKTCLKTFRSKLKAIFHAFLHVYPEDVLSQYENDLSRRKQRPPKPCPDSDEPLSTKKRVKRAASAMVQLSGSLKVDEAKLNLLSSTPAKKQKPDGLILALNGRNCCTAFSNYREIEEEVNMIHDGDCQRDKACLLCKVCLGNKEELTYHYRQLHRNHDGNGYTCQICRAKLLTYVAFSQHVRDKHLAFFVPDLHEYGVTQMSKSDWDPQTGAMLFPCDNCKQTFQNFSRLRLHRIVAKNLDCKMCGKLNCQPVDYVRHMKQVHGKRAEDLKKFFYVCDPCKKSYFSVEKYKHHVAGHFSGHYNCLYCNELLLDNEELDEHLETEHFGKVAHYSSSELCCPKCELDLITLPELKLHIYEEHLNTSRVFVCSKSKSCSKLFRSEDRLKTHVEKEHVGLADSDNVAHFKSAANGISHVASARSPSGLNSVPELICLD